MSEKDEKLATKAMFETVWEMMRKHGMKEIVVSFSGEGDSGDITDITAVGYDEQPQWSSAVNQDEYNAVQRAYAEKVVALNQLLDAPTGIISLPYNPATTLIVEGEGEERDLSLRLLVGLLTEPMLEPLPDWVNNDGGFGMVYWNLDTAHADKEPLISIELSIRVVSTEDYNYEYDRLGHEFDVPDEEPA